MNRKQLILLIVVAAVVGGLGYWSNQKKQAGYDRGTTAEGGQKMLKGVKPEAIRDVAGLSIRQGSNEVNLVVQGDKWTLKERGGYPANFATIKETVQKFFDAKIARPVEVGPSRLPRLKLTKEEATFVDIKDDKG